MASKLVAGGRDCLLQLFCKVFRSKFFRFSSKSPRCHSGTTSVFSSAAVDSRCLIASECRWVIFDSDRCLLWVLTYRNREDWAHLFVTSASQTLRFLFRTEYKNPETTFNPQSVWATYSHSSSVCQRSCFKQSLWSQAFICLFSHSFRPLNALHLSYGLALVWRTQGHGIDPRFQGTS